MRTLASLGMGEGQLWVIVLCCSCAMLEIGCAGANESNCFLWRRDAQKWEGGGGRIGYCGRVCCWRRKKERKNESINLQKASYEEGGGITFCVRMSRESVVCKVY